MVGRQRGRDHRARLPRPRRSSPRLTEEQLAEVRGWIEAAGLAMRDGILAADAEIARGRPGLARRATSRAARRRRQLPQVAPHHRRAPRARAADAGTSTAMFSWLCTKADPRTGRLRTSWPTSASRRGSAANHVEQALPRPQAQGLHRVPPSIAAGGAGWWKSRSTNFRWPTALTRRSATLAARSAAEVPAEVPAEVLAEVPAELEAQKPTNQALH